MKTILQQWKTERNFQTVDVVQVENIAKKAKTPCRWSKNSLHKNFKLILEQNVIEHTYLKINSRLQKMYCWTIFQPKLLL